MYISDETKAMLLFCTRLGLKNHEKLFSPNEWQILTQKLSKKGMSCGMLPLFDGYDMRQAELSASEIERIVRLREGRNLSYILQAYEQQIDLHIIGQCDRHYPTAFREQLKTKAPVLLYAVGNMELLIHYEDKIAMVGRRRCHIRTPEICAALVETFSSPHSCFISGGAKGVDQLTQQSVSDRNGNIIIILPHGLNKEAVENIAGRQKGKYLLLSAEEPNAEFQAYRALRRNTLIYALSQRAIVVEAGAGSGGTWRGAKDAIQNHWTDVLVWNEPDYEGNQRLCRMGAEPIYYPDIIPIKE